MANVNTVDKRPVPLLMSPRDAGKLLLGGLVVGLLTLALYFVFDKYVLTPGLCSEMNTAAGRCENKLYFANAFAMVLGAFAGLFVTVQQRVFRPLLVVILVTAGLWNVIMLTTGMAWWLHALVTAVLFGGSYLMFAWIVQLRNFIVSLVIAITLVVLMRLILVG